MLLAAALAASDAPLSVRTAGTFRDLFLDPTLSDARPPERPEADLRWTVSNSWSTPTTLTRGTQVAFLQNDEQGDSLTVSATVPWSAVPRVPAWLAGRGATSLEWRVTAHWGGWTDPPISALHRAIRVYDFQRQRNPRDAVRIELGDGGAAPAIDVRGTRFAPGDVVLRSGLALARGGVASDGVRDRWAVAARLDAKAPTGSLSAAGGSGGFDGAVALTATWELAPWLTVHGMAALSRLSPLPRDAVLQPRRWQRTAEASLAFRAGRWTLLVEDRLSSALLEGGWTFAGAPGGRRASAFNAAFRPHNQLSLGARRGPLTFWISEDVTPGRGDVRGEWFYLSNAPDFAFGLAWRRAL